MRRNASRKAERENWRRKGWKSRLDELNVGYTPAVAMSWTGEKKPKSATISNTFNHQLVVDVRFVNVSQPNPIQRKP